MPSRTIRPTDLELTILRVLWTTGPVSVRDVHVVLNREKPTGYTTVLKMLQIMTTKGLVVRDETVRPQIYRAKQSQDRMQRHLLRDLMARAYGGSMKSLVMHALGTTRSSAEDVAEIEALLDRIETDPAASQTGGPEGPPLRRRAEALPLRTETGGPEGPPLRRPRAETGGPEGPPLRTLHTDRTRRRGGPSGPPFPSDDRFVPDGPTGPPLRTRLRIRRTLRGGGK